MSATHTPGPWKWFDYPDGRKLLVAPARSVIHCPDAPMEVDKPDQVLIAAAPEMKEALKGLVDAVTVEVNEKGAGGFLLARLADAKDALAKAEPQ